MLLIRILYSVIRGGGYFFLGDMIFQSFKFLLNYSFHVEMEIRFGFKVVFILNLIVCLITVGLGFYLVKKKREILYWKFIFSLTILIAVICSYLTEDFWQSKIIILIVNKFLKFDGGGAIEFIEIIVFYLYLFLANGIYFLTKAIVLEFRRTKKDQLR